MTRPFDNLSYRDIEETIYDIEEIVDTTLYDNNGPLDVSDEDMATCNKLLQDRLELFDELLSIQSQEDLAGIKTQLIELLSHYKHLVEEGGLSPELLNKIQFHISIRTYDLAMVEAKMNKPKLDYSKTPRKKRKPQ